MEMTSVKLKTVVIYVKESSYPCEKRRELSDAITSIFIILVHHAYGNIL